jgi:hypothetical protein
MRVRCEAFRFVALVVLAIAVARAQPAGQASGQASARLPVSVTVAPRLSLQVSTRVLTFHVTGASPVDASMELSAGVRIASGSAVALVADVDAQVPGTLTIVAGPEGTTPVSVTAGASTVVAKWVGGGLRTGRLTFRLAAAPGVYVIPVTIRLQQAAD